MNTKPSPTVTSANLWNNEDPIVDLEAAYPDYDWPEVPAWVDEDISSADVAAIAQGGCMSGAYMPAVTYHMANQIMAEHGDDVLDFLVTSMGELPKPDNTESWSGMACFYLSYAVELWADGVEDTLTEILAQLTEEN